MYFCEYMFTFQLGVQLGVDLQKYSVHMFTLIDTIK